MERPPIYQPPNLPTIQSNGQWWRFLTGHWTHCSLDHLLWNTVVFMFLGALCERDARGRFLACVGASSLMIPIAVWWVQADLETYRGLSGVDSALFALLVVTMVREKIALRNWVWVVAALAMFAAFAAKFLYELTSGHTFFVDSAGTFVPVPLAHTVGAAIGLICVAWPFTSSHTVSLVAHDR